jgi:hypothetical protein
MSDPVHRRWARDFLFTQEYCGHQFDVYRSHRIVVREIAGKYDTHTYLIVRWGSKNSDRFEWSDPTITPYQMSSELADLIAARLALIGVVWDRNL